MLTLIFLIIALFIVVLVASEAAYRYDRDEPDTLTRTANYGLVPLAIIQFGFCVYIILFS